MKRIGIVTLYHKNYNYGGQLQAFAMQKVFSMYGNSAKIVAFESNSSVYMLQRLKDLGLKRSIVNIKNKLCFKFLMQDKEFRSAIHKKPKRFDSFIDDIPHTEVYNEATIDKCNQEFDLFVCGSDQIWNPGWWNDILFLSFTKKPKFSYAASIARTDLTEKECNYIKNNINDYLAVSVREKQAKDLLEKRVGKTIYLTLDPTLLVEKKVWEEMVKAPLVKEKYVLFYMVGDSKGLKKKVYAQCKKMRYKVYSIGFSKNTYLASDVRYSDYIIKDAGPREWLGWIANAEYIFTDSFHGSVFSIIFGKQFWCFERDNPYDLLNENSRIYNFLSISGLEDRLLEYNTDIQLYKNSNRINFEVVENNLIEYRVNSIEFIQKCLNKVNSDA